MSDALETALEEWCCSLLKMWGAHPQKRGQDGEGDREVFWGDGLVFWLEFKKERGGHRRAAQKVYKKWADRAGYEYQFIETKEQFLDFMTIWEALHGPASARRPA